MVLEKSLVNADKSKLISEFFSNIGVAWFTAGVIGTFLSGAKTYAEVLISFSWGIGFSVLFLFVGTSFLKK